MTDITQKLTKASEFAANTRCRFGSNWNDGSSGGVWALHLYDARAKGNSNVGFRPDEIRELLRLAQIGLAYESATNEKE